MNNMAKQMEMFETGGLMDEGGTVDPVSGNDVPPGSNQEEVRDDIPAQLSEGEFVFPADVVRFIGLEKLMMIRQRAKAGLQRMDDMGQMGNSEEAVMPDDLPFSIEDLDMEDEDEYNTPQEFAVGGMPNANSGVFFNPASQPTTGVAAAPVQAASASVAPNIGQAATPVQAGSAGSAGSAGQPTMRTNYQLPQAPVPVMAAPSTLPSFLGEVTPGVGGVDYTEETYVNEAGQTIKFRRYNDGSLKDSSGNEAVIPEGYKIKSEAEKDVGTGPVKVETATVQDDGDGGDNEEDDGLGPGGGSVGWGGQKDMSKRGGPFGGLKTGFTQVGISYFNTGTLGVAGALSFVGGRLTGKDVPAGVDVGMTVGGVTTKISAADYNKAKAAGYMGTFSDGLLEKAQTNVAIAGQLSSKYGLNKTQGTFEDFVNDAVESKLGIEELAKDYNIDLDEVKSGFLGLGKDYDDVVDKAVKEANKGYTGDDPFTADDIKSGHAARTTIDAQNAEVNAKAAAQRAADRDSDNNNDSPSDNNNQSGPNDAGGYDDYGGNEPGQATDE